MGRSLPIWNTFSASSSFEPGKPWLLEIFDQIRFHEVTEEELAMQRRDFLAGTYHIKVTEEIFDFAEHKRFCEGLDSEVTALRKRQATAAAEVMAKDSAILAKLEAAGYLPGAGKGQTKDADDRHEQYDGDEFDKVRSGTLACVHWRSRMLTIGLHTDCRTIPRTCLGCQLQNR